jgi:hypothetical protein
MPASLEFNPKRAYPAVFGARSSEQGISHGAQ